MAHGALRVRRNQAYFGLGIDLDLCRIYSARGFLHGSDEGVLCSACEIEEEASAEDLEILSCCCRDIVTARYSGFWVCDIQVAGKVCL